MLSIENDFPQYHRKKRLKKEWIIVFCIVIIPLFISSLLVLPNYNEVTFAGDIVSVKDVGIDGNVHFTYVQSGYTRNYYEQFSLMFVHRGDIDIEPIDREVYESFEWMAEDDQMRLDSIDAAVEHTSDWLEVPSSEFDEVYVDILDYTTEYVGDSFGLMLAVGLTEEKTGEDFSKRGRYKIAGTGTIEYDGTVGSIGAVRQKLLTAYREGVDIFFVPGDQDRYYYYGLSNEEEAEQVNTEERLRLKIVPVDTLEEAVQYLRNLP